MQFYMGWLSGVHKCSSKVGRAERLRENVIERNFMWERESSVEEEKKKDDRFCEIENEG